MPALRILLVEDCADDADLLRFQLEDAGLSFELRCASSERMLRDTLDAFSWQDSAGRMQPCLEQLEPVRRNCVLHAYVDGLSHSEIALRVGAPLGTVKAWIKRSLLNLRECLQ